MLLLSKLDFYLYNPNNQKNISFIELKRAKFFIQICVSIFMIAFVECYWHLLIHIVSLMINTRLYSIIIMYYMYTFYYHHQLYWQHYASLKHIKIFKLVSFFLYMMVSVKMLIWSNWTKKKPMFYRYSIHNKTILT